MLRANYATKPLDGVNFVQSKLSSSFPQHISSKCFEKKHLVWVTTAIALAAIMAIGIAIESYRKHQLMQPVECRFGNTPEENRLAYEYYTKETERTGDPAHQYCLAVMNIKGIGTAKSFDIALGLLKQAARQGLQEAKYILCYSCELFRNANLSEETFGEILSLARSYRYDPFSWFVNEVDVIKCLPCDGPQAFQNPEYVCANERLEARLQKM